MAMKITDALRKYAKEHLGVKEGTSDADLQKVVSKALLGGKLKAAELTKLLGSTAPPPAPPPTPVDPAVFSKSVDDAVEAKLAKLGIGVGGGGGEDRLKPESIFSKAGTNDVRVKGAFERYSDSKGKAYYPSTIGGKGILPHPWAGKQAKHEGNDLDSSSERDRAVAGAYMKWAFSAVHGNAPMRQRPSDHDKDLLAYAMRHMAWTGILKGLGTEDGGIKVNRRSMTEMEVKILLDDSTSGGINVAPVVFDDAIILIPVLMGQLYPFVNVVPVARGRRMISASMLNPTISDGVAEGTAITPFTTTSMISAFNNTIWPAVGALQMGIDFEEDSPVDVGGTIINNYGLKAAEYLDNVIANGNGTSQPTGLFLTSGVTATPSDNGPGGPLTVSDIEALMFAVAPAYRFQPGAVLAFVSNDTMYQRVKGIPVGPTDERRVFGMDHGKYTVFDHPWKIQQSIANGYMAFVNLQRYRMYRRLGVEITVETQGYTLALSHTRLIVLRMRFGGALEDAGAMGLMTDAHA